MTQADSNRPLQKGLSGAGLTFWPSREGTGPGPASHPALEREAQALMLLQRDS